LPLEESMEHLQHAATCDFCSQKLRAASRIFEDDLSPAEEAAIDSFPSTKPDRQRELADRLGRDSKLNYRSSETKCLRAVCRKLFLYLTPVAAAVLMAFFLIGRDPVRRVEGQLAEAYTLNRSIEMRFAGTHHADIQQHRGGSEGSLINKPDAY